MSGSVTQRRRAPRAVPRNAAVDLAKLGEYAGLHAPVEDAAALLDIEAAELQVLVDDTESDVGRTWRRGRAEARLNLRRAQFALMEKNATIAVYLGKELLGQDGGGAAGPVTLVVDTGICREADGKD